MDVGKILGGARESAAPFIYRAFGAFNFATGGLLEPTLVPVASALSGEISGVKASLYPDWEYAVRSKASGGLVLRDGPTLREQREAPGIHAGMLEKAEKLQETRGLGRYAAQEAILRDMGFNLKGLG